MADYKIFETDGFASDLKGDFSGIVKKLRKKLKDYVYPQLRKEPYFGKNIKKLRNYKPDTWRYRVGDFRFFYEIDEKEKLVIMLSADKRKDAY